MRYLQRQPAHIAILLAYFNTHNAYPAVGSHLKELGLTLGRKTKPINLLTTAQRTALLARHENGNSVWHEHISAAQMVASSITYRSRMNTRSGRRQLAWSR